MIGGHRSYSLCCGFLVSTCRFIFPNRSTAAFWKAPWLLSPSLGNPACCTIHTAIRPRSSRWSCSSHKLRRGRRRRRAWTNRGRSCRGSSRRFACASHLLHGIFGEIAFALPDAAVEDHLAESPYVACGGKRYRRRASADDCGHLEDISAVQWSFLPDRSWPRSVCTISPTDETVVIRPERRVLHAQRLEQAFVQKCL